MSRTQTERRDKTFLSINSMLLVKRNLFWTQTAKTVYFYLGRSNTCEHTRTYLWSCMICNIRHESFFNKTSPLTVLSHVLRVTSTIPTTVIIPNLKQWKIIASQHCHVMLKPWNVDILLSLTLWRQILKPHNYVTMNEKKFVSKVCMMTHLLSQSIC